MKSLIVVAAVFSAVVFTGCQEFSKTTYHLITPECEAYAVPPERDDTGRVIVPGKGPVASEEHRKGFFDVGTFSIAPKVSVF